MGMPVSLSIKNVPDEIVRRLRERAEGHHRSLQGELMAILEEAAGTSRPLSPDEVLAERSGLTAYVASDLWLRTQDGLRTGHAQQAIGGGRGYGM
jgi:plasmid stability protein